MIPRNLQTIYNQIQELTQATNHLKISFQSWQCKNNNLANAMNLTDTM